MPLPSLVFGLRPGGAARARAVPGPRPRPSPARPVPSPQPGGARSRPAPPREDLNSVENDSQKRTFVAFGLIFALTAVYMTWFAPSPPPPRPVATAADAGTVAPGAAPLVAAPVPSGPT